MGVGYYRTRNHQSLRAIAEEGATVQSWLTGKTRGNDCVTYSPAGGKGLWLIHGSEESVDWNWRTRVPLFLPVGEPGWSPPWGQTSMQAERRNSAFSFTITASRHWGPVMSQLFISWIYLNIDIKIQYHLHCLIIWCLKCLEDLCCI